MKPVRDQRGVIIIGAFIVTFFFLITALAVAEFGVSHYSSTRRTLVAANAMDAADAGADAFMYQINQDSNYQGTNSAPSNSTNSCSYTPTPTTLANNAPQGKVTYESCVQNGSLSNEKIVTVTGKVYIPSGSATPLVARKLQLVIASSNAGTSYIVQSGNGGLTMTNSAATGAGDFYLNGRLNLSNAATIGDASGTKASHLWVAGMGCGSGASYPQQCSGATGQTDLPIYIANNAHIYADVHSPNMTGGGSDGSSTRSKMTNTGLVDGNATAISMPDNNRATVMARNSWTSVAASSGSCSHGNVTWAAGTHFTGGNVTVSNTCKVTVNGDIWIDGGLQLSNSGSLTVGNGITTQPNILIDGQSGFKPLNNTSLIANSSGTTFRVNAYWSTAGSCSTTCPVPTGADLLTTQATNTIVFSNAFTAPGSSFYSVWSGILVNNGTNIGQLIGQQINLNNSGTITFSGGTIQSGGPTNWDVKHYEVIYQ